MKKYNNLCATADEDIVECAGFGFFFLYFNKFFFKYRFLSPPTGHYGSYTNS